MIPRPAVLIIATAILIPLSAAPAADSLQWGGSDGKNMVSAEKNLPETFTPGEHDPHGGGVILSTAKNVKWAARLGSMTCSTPAVACGRVFIGFCRDKHGVLLCLDEKTGKPLWQYSSKARQVPPTIDGRKCWYTVFPPQVGLASSPAVDDGRVYIVSQRCEVICMDVRGGTLADAMPTTQPTESAPAIPGPKILWTFDMWDYGVRPSDVCDGSVIVHGDLVYVPTSNGVDRDADAAKKDELRKPPAPDAPNIIALDKKTGRLVAVDSAPVGPNLLHGQWGSPSLGKVGDKTLLFYGAGDGVCYAFGTLDKVPPAVGQKPLVLPTVWRFDCDPPEYKAFGDLGLVTHYVRGDKRRKDSLNKANDGTFVGMSEIIATPVFYDGKVCIAIGRDPAHGRGRGALYCIDAAKTGDITASGKVWSYQGLDRTLSTVSISGGLLYIADMAGRLHCLDARTGKCLWVHETHSEVWGSTLVADGRIYFPTKKDLWVLAAGAELKVLDKINLGSAVWSTPVAANGVLFVASQGYLWAVAK